jgi:hypothetical protein
LRDRSEASLAGNAGFRLMLAFPKPGKAKRRSTFRDAREICRTQPEWDARRKNVHDRAGGRCERIKGRYRCNRLAPLHDVLDAAYGEVRYPAGHAHHKNGTRGLGGGKRDDSLENLDWLCSICHWDEHIPTKVIPSKRRL